MRFIRIFIAFESFMYRNRRHFKANESNETAEDNYAEDNNIEDDNVENDNTEDAKDDDNKANETDSHAKDPRIRCPATCGETADDSGGDDGNKCHNEAMVHISQQPDSGRCQDNRCLSNRCRIPDRRVADDICN
jgi:hypothetical protein